MVQVELPHPSPSSPPSCYGSYTQCVNTVNLAFKRQRKLDKSLRLPPPSLRLRNQGPGKVSLLTSEGTLTTLEYRKSRTLHFRRHHHATGLTLNVSTLSTWLLNGSANSNLASKRQRKLDKSLPLPSSSLRLRNQDSRKMTHKLRALAELRTSHAARLRQHHLAAQGPGHEQRAPKPLAPLRIRYTRGRRDLPGGWEDLREEDLYLTDALPPLLALTYLPIEDTCTLCLGLKSHPVRYACGHSHCYVCIRIWLNRDWCCPECKTMMYRAPTRATEMEADIAATYSAWKDESEVDYSWDGLRFPARPRLWCDPTSDQLYTEDDDSCSRIRCKLIL
ncbi:hypothetical protein GGX14DRAFT_571689 [Mycena pura]|uniref:RING-type domain-containing protein n=1 Tax=Mycena pura TaxID=153505 RepID=A0AAD6V2F2_9AGAR|nr:hypothetical protein GGX14DRAFT_571689 [Mycena pura]